MQTFLPYPDFVQSAKALDYRRLGKQRLEAMQLVNSTNKLADNPNAKVGWMNHPARFMWIGYMDALKLYHNVCIQEWVARGYNNNMKLYYSRCTLYGMGCSHESSKGFRVFGILFQGKEVIRQGLAMNFGLLPEKVHHGHGV